MAEEVADGELFAALPPPMEYDAWIAALPTTWTPDGAPGGGFWDSEIVSPDNLEPLDLLERACNVKNAQLAEELRVPGLTYKSFQKANHDEATARIWNRSDRKTKFVSVYQFAGAAGKTTTAHSIAFMLAAEGHRVLTLDLDPQCDLTTMFDTHLDVHLHPLPLNKSQARAAAANEARMMRDGAAPVAGDVAAAGVRRVPTTLLEFLTAVREFASTLLVLPLPHLQCLIPPTHAPNPNGRLFMFRGNRGLHRIMDQLSVEWQALLRYMDNPQHRVSNASLNPANNNANFLSTIVCALQFVCAAFDIDYVIADYPSGCSPVHRMLLMQSDLWISPSQCVKQSADAMTYLVTAVPEWIREFDMVVEGCADISRRLGMPRVFPCRPRSVRFLGTAVCNYASHNFQGNPYANAQIPVFVQLNNATAELINVLAGLGHDSTMPQDWYIDRKNAMLAKHELRSAPGNIRPGLLCIIRHFYQLNHLGLAQGIAVPLLRRPHLRKLTFVMEDGVSVQALLAAPTAAQTQWLNIHVPMAYRQLHLIVEAIYAGVVAAADGGGGGGGGAGERRMGADGEGSAVSASASVGPATKKAREARE